MFRQPFTWREIERLRRDMDRLLESSVPMTQRHRGSGFPAINVWNNNSEGLVVMAEVPGVDPSDLDISITGDTLTLSGGRFPEVSPDEVTYHRRERRHGEFSRKFQLPYTINKDKVEADMRNGVLRVTLPKAEADRPRQIAVRASQ